MAVHLMTMVQRPRPQSDRCGPAMASRLWSSPRRVNPVRLHPGRGESDSCSWSSPVLADEGLRPPLVFEHLGGPLSSGRNWLMTQDLVLRPARPVSGGHNGRAGRRDGSTDEQLVRRCRGSRGSGGPGGWPGLHLPREQARPVRPRSVIPCSLRKPFGAGTGEAGDALRCSGSQGWQESGCEGRRPSQRLVHSGGVFGGWGVAVEGLLAVGAAGFGGAVGVQGELPASAVDADVVVELADQDAVFQ
jgi:hypothetical protein